MTAPNTKIARILLVAFTLIGCSASQTKPSGIYQPAINQPPTKAAITPQPAPAPKVKTGVYDPQTPAATQPKPTLPHKMLAPSLNNEQISNYPPIIGEASWYGPGFHGKKTANGEIYNENGLTAAHRTLPLGSHVKVINLENNKEVVVRINDRGPFVGDRILDGSKRVAELLGYKIKGTAKVKLLVLDNPAAKANTQVRQALPSPANKTSKNNAEKIISAQKHVVQVGSFRNQDNAVRHRQRLSAQYQNLIFTINRSNQNFFQVLVGPFNNRYEAQTVAESFTKAGISNLVRSYNNI